jgi:hypothetical protein
MSSFQTMLYFGLRSPGGAWAAQCFVRNPTNADKTHLAGAE